MKAYYAHPLSIYNTKQEARDLATIKELGLEVLNPNGPEHDAGYKAVAATNGGNGMPYFDSILAQCDLIVFRAFPDGSIPAGVAKEIDYFRTRNLPIIELPSCARKRVLSVEATRDYLAESGNR